MQLALSGFLKPWSSFVFFRNKYCKLFQKEEFPLGMFIVFVVHSTNEACSSKPSSNGNRDKFLTFKLESSIGAWNYIKAVSAVLIAFFMIFLTAASLVLCSKRYVL